MFSTGTEVYCAADKVSINPNLSVADGHEGHFSRHLTYPERVELGEYMQKLWKKYTEKFNR